MKSFLNIQSIAVMVLAVALGAGLLYTSQATQDADDVLARLQKAIEREGEAIALLDAEWAYLNSPQRLEKLAVEFYGVETPSASQMIDGTEALDLPFPVPIQTEPHHLMQPVSYNGGEVEAGELPVRDVGPVR